jgi:hypothetical protein
MALSIKDGAGSTTSLKTTLTGSDHMPHHIVQAVSGSVTVTSSLAAPVYVTGNVSINQPVNVDVDISDKLTVVVSSSANNNSLWVTSSTTYPVYTQLSNIATTGIPGGGTALVVSLSGSTGSFNQVQLFDSYVTIANTGINQLIGYLTAATDLGDSDYRIKVITTGSSAVAINNAAADVAFNALSYSFAENSLKVKLTGSNTIKEGAYDILLVRTTGSETTIANTGFQQAINYVTAATDLSDNQYKIKVKITGSTEDSPQYVTGTLNTNLFGVNKYGLSAGSALVVKVTASSDSDPVIISGSTDIGVTKYGFSAGSALIVKVTASNSDTYPVQLNNVSTVAYSEGQALVVKVTASTDGPYGVTLDGISSYGYSGGAALVTKLTQSGMQNEPFWVTGTVNSNASVSVNDGLKVELSGTNVKQLSGSSSNTYLQTSIAPVATTSTLKSYVLPNWGGPVPTGDANVILFDWSTPDSGTVCAASSSVTRKSLTIFNDSQYNVYFMIGLPHAEQTNGFNLYSTTNRPNAYSFVLYPSGTYFAEPHNVGMRHSMYLVSGSLSGETKISVTETY